MRQVGPTGAGVLEKPRRAHPPRKRRWLPVSELEFVGCDSCRMTLAEYEAYPEDGKKIEFFDSEAGLAWTVRERPGPDHEAPARILVQLLREISMTRGSPIRCLGASQLRLLDTDSDRYGPSTRTRCCSCIRSAWS